MTVSSEVPQKAVLCILFHNFISDLETNKFLFLFLLRGWRTLGWGSCCSEKVLKILLEQSIQYEFSVLAGLVQSLAVYIGEMYKRCITFVAHTDSLELLLGYLSSSCI